jgi:hypothetical protein
MPLNSGASLDRPLNARQSWNAQIQEDSSEKPWPAE